MRLYNIVKKMLLVCICFSVVLSADVKAIENNTNYQSSVEFVSSLKIMTGSGGSFDEESFVTRAQLSKILATIYGENPESYTGESHFADVSDKDWFYPFVNTAYDLGCINGYTDGTFKPNQPARYSEILRCMLEVAGYTDYTAALYGSGEKDVVNMSIKCGIAKGISLSPEAYVTRGNMSKIIYNTLTMDAMRVDSVSGKGDISYSVNDDDTVLYMRMGIEKIEGVFTSTGAISMLDDDDVSERNKVKIDSTVMLNSTGKSHMDKIGYNGVFYVKTKNVTMPELVFADFSAKHNELVTIYSDEIEEVSLQCISYTDRGTGRAKKMNLPDDVKVVYNGRVLYSYDKNIFKPNLGKLMLVNKNVLIIQDMKTYVIDRFDYTNELIYDMYSGDSVKVEDIDNNVYITDKGKDMGNPLYNAPYYSVLDVMESKDKKSAIMVLTEESFTGKVSEINAEDNKITVDGKEYEMAKSFMNVYKDDAQTTKLYKTIRIGDEIEFYLNSLGQIAGCDIDYVGGFSYGYLLAAAETKTISKSVQFKIYTSGGSEAIYDINDKVTINGKKGVTDNTEVLDAIENGKPQLIKYRLNNEHAITEFQTAVDNRSGEERFIKDKFSLDFKTDLTGKATRIYSYGVGANFSIGDETTVFFIPDDINSIKKFRTGDKTLLSGDIRDCDIELYDTDEAGMARVIIYYSGGSGGVPSSTLWKDSAFVISKISMIKVEENNSYGVKLRGFKNGKEIDIICEDEEMENYGAGNHWITAYGGLYAKKSVMELKKGDIILADLDTFGKMKGFLLMLSPNELPATYNEVMSDGGTPSENNHLAGTSTHYGKVIKRYRSAVLANANGNGDDALWNKTFAFGGTSVYLYESETDKVTLIPTDEINPGDTVFIRKALNDTKEVYIIR